MKSEQLSRKRDVKLQKVLGKLNVFSIEVSKAQKRTLATLFAKYLDAPAASPSNVGRTYVMRHCINTGDAPPFKDGFRNPQRAWRAFLDQEMKRLLSFGNIF